jgi:DNA/RNA endonuclease YhcR with UshA esterase domain
MAIDFRSTTITFDSTRGQVQNESATVIFNSRVIRAEVALKGFDVQFTDEDHNFFRQLIDPSILAVNDNTATVNVTYLLRDSSGNIDDRYQGSVAVLVIAEVQ